MRDKKRIHRSDHCVDGEPKEQLKPTNAEAGVYHFHLLRRAFKRIIYFPSFRIYRLNSLKTEVHFQDRHIFRKRIALNLFFKEERFRNENAEKIDGKKFFFLSNGSGES
ncbi:hypothetical protein DLM75_19960 [Leptospira stimsonii]|uniref:Uncharacterized protein n=1 Tax=Leptospira stimsonii TaxID=2202203 RepID=A0A396YRE1_9LEPT|nr:hypothetical protein DLM75_19960 [Leptospira stimsonii]